MDLEPFKALMMHCIMPPKESHGRGALGNPMDLKGGGPWKEDWLDTCRVFISGFHAFNAKSTKYGGGQLYDNFLFDLAEFAIFWQYMAMYYYIIWPCYGLYGDIMAIFC